MGVFDVIKNIFINLYELLGNLIVLFGYTISAVLAAIFGYLIVIRPIWGSLFKKGERLYWLGVLILILYGFIIGPIIFIKIADKYGDSGIVIGLVIYLVGVYAISYPGIKKEKEKNNRW